MSELEERRFDVVVLGGGPGGYPAAIRAAQSGKSVALIEANQLGGTCLNRGCIPTKVLIANGDVLNKIRKAEEFGITVTGVAFDYGKMNSRKDRIVLQVRKSLEQLITANKITIIRGYGRFTSPKQLKVIGKDNCLVSGESIIIATGSEPKDIAAFPFDNKRIHSSTSMLELTELPKSLVIVGGGVIGCEFASLYRSLGIEVTILEALEDILFQQAVSVRNTLKKAFEHKGIKIETSVAVQKIDVTDKGVTVNCGPRNFEADMALVAIGRSRNTRDIGLEKAGVVVNKDGEIPTTDDMRTNVKHIYAIGDITRNWWLAHVASHQGLVAASNAVGKPARMHYNAVPAVIFTEPEIGTVGLTLEQAIEDGYKATVGSFPFQFLGKSLATDDIEGFAQIVTDRSTGQILGAQVVGYEAATLVAEMGVAIANELTVECLTDTIHAHPTIAEAWLEAAMIAGETPLHLPPKRGMAFTKG
ncbi:MAG: dihydrolipoyl dehydrogenase [Chlamydiales bacterium]|nr:dihydrolipoyl dehydrogenase [Chlamydiales bacterium]